jgi:hypothetical protein
MGWRESPNLTRTGETESKGEPSIANFQFRRPTAGRRRRHWRSRIGSQCRSDLTEQPELPFRGSLCRPPPDLLPDAQGGRQSGG